MAIQNQHFNVIDSTNKEAHRIVKSRNLSDTELKAGIVITADEQEDGIGREDRSWHSEHNGGLYYTLILKPRSLTQDDLKDMSLSVAREVQACVIELSNLYPDLKWPNDIMLHNKKCGGILVDCISSAASPSPHIMIIGIGLNLNQRIFPDELLSIATSLYQHTHRYHDKQRYISRITERLIDLLGYEHTV